MRVHGTTTQARQRPRAGRLRATSLQPAQTGRANSGGPSARRRTALDLRGPDRAWRAQLDLQEPPQAGAGSGPGASRTDGGRDTQVEAPDRDCLGSRRSDASRSTPSPDDRGSTLGVRASGTQPCLTMRSASSTRVSAVIFISPPPFDVSRCRLPGDLDPPNTMRASTNGEAPQNVPANQGSDC